MIEEKKIYEFLDDMEKRLNILHNLCESCFSTEELNEKLLIIDTIRRRLKVLNIFQDSAIKYDECVVINSIYYEDEIMEWCI